MVLIAHRGAQWPFLYMTDHGFDPLVGEYGWTSCSLLATHLGKRNKKKNKQKNQNWMI